MWTDAPSFDAVADRGSFGVGSNRQENENRSTALAERERRDISGTSGWKTTTKATSGSEHSLTMNGEIVKI